MKIENVEFDDWTVNEDTKTAWTQVCKKHKHLFNVNSLDDIGNGICGVKGCNEEADYYLDFSLEGEKQ